MEFPFGEALFFNVHNKAFSAAQALNLRHRAVKPTFTPARIG